MTRSFLLLFLLMAACETGADRLIPGSDPPRYLPELAPQDRLALYRQCLEQRRGDQCFCAGVAGGWRPATVEWLDRQMGLDCRASPGHFYVDGGTQTLVPGGLRDAP